jgi:hypothetical protein
MMMGQSGTSYQAPHTERRRAVGLARPGAPSISAGWVLNLAPRATLEQGQGGSSGKEPNVVQNMFRSFKVRACSILNSSFADIRLHLQRLAL